MGQLKPLDYKILSELMKNAKTSDRLIAKKIEVSQPTVTRRRARLEKELSLNYTTIPDWSKLGFEILALTLAKWRHKTYPDERVQEALEFLSRHPNILFISTGRGLDSDRVCISIHKDYREYHRLMQEFRQQWEKYLEKLESFIISIEADNILRPITLKPLANYIQEHS